MLLFKMNQNREISDNVSCIRQHSGRIKHVTYFFHPLRKFVET